MRGILSVAEGTGLRVRARLRVRVRVRVRVQWWIIVEEGLSKRE